MNPVKDVVEGKILSEMKKYRQSNSFAATTTGCDTGDTETQDIRSMRFSVSF